MTDSSLEMWKCQFFDPSGKYSLPVEKLSASASRASLCVAATNRLKHVALLAVFCVTIVDFSKFEIDLLFVLRCSRCGYPDVQSHAIDKVDWQYTINCLPTWSWWESSCCRMYLGNRLLPEFLNWFLFRWKYRVRSMKLEYVNHLQCDNISCSLKNWNVVPPRIDANSRKHQRLGLKWAANVTTSLALRKQISALSFFVHSMSLNIDMKMIFSSKESGVCPLKCSWKCLLNWIVESPGNTHQMNRTSRAANAFVRQIHVRSIHPSMSLAYYWKDLDLRLTHNVESENTWTFILINFCCWISKEILDHRNVFQSCKICMLYASVRSINVFTSRCADGIKSCVLGKLFVYRKVFGDPL